MRVCVFVGNVRCAKTAELIEIPFGGLTLVGPRNHVLDGVQQGGTNPFAAARRGVRVTIRRFGISSKLFDHFFTWCW